MKHRGRPTVHAETTIINRAQKVFWEKGYTATSLSDLLEASGSGSGSFYNTFRGGKKEVFSKSIQQRRDAFAAFKKQTEETERPVELIKNFFRGIANEPETEHKKGCIIANTLVEMTFIDAELEAEASKILKEVEQMFVTCIAYEQENRTLKTNISALLLGRQLITFWCGLNSLRRMYPDKNILSEQIELQLAILS
ncbi:TetR family transcriptional regulator [Flavobacterium akiainvivens]|uniref:TetR family transcriptional regulator n=1 Tax=Flavobacterium akiainvivens TaxID=1202724 RepID=A0A0M8MK69_9FLAO|nr:TetR/AcrR family transcriptional regulator [Flavobacterium akiainvivens]KOS07517.1 TetR family transcriptional regulator [Flavobacterium akiainvivens]SFQ63907.1 transcriptional regulator, TetR family [Flavobacterium akiainvivens]